MENLTRRQLMIVVFFANVLVFASFVGVLFFVPPPTKEILTDAYPVLLALGAAAAAYRIYQSTPDERLLRRAWRVMFFAMCFWLAAETLWISYELRGLSPYPSAADVFYITGDVLLVAFFLLQSSFLRVFVDGIKRWIGFTALGVFIAVSAALVYQPILSSAAKAPLTDILLPVLYETLYLLMLIGATNLALALWGGAAVKRWLAIALGVWLYAFANQLFFFAEWNGFYRNESQMDWTGSAFDLLYVASYQLLLTGFYLRLRLAPPKMNFEDILFSLKRPERQTVWVLLSDRTANTIFVDPRLPAAAEKEVGKLVGESVESILRLPSSGLGNILETLQNQKVMDAPVKILLGKEVYALYAILDGDDADAKIYWIISPWQTGGKLNLKETSSPEKLLGYAMRGMPVPFSRADAETAYVQSALSFLTLTAAHFGGADVARQFAAEFGKAETTQDRRASKEILQEALKRLLPLASPEQIQESSSAFHASLDEQITQAAKEAGIFLDVSA